jgi:hypothetical protein
VCCLCSVWWVRIRARVAFEEGVDVDGVERGRVLESSFRRFLGGGIVLCVWMYRLGGMFVDLEWTRKTIPRRGWQACFCSRHS